MDVIYLESIARAQHLLSICYRYNDYRFEVGIWYDSVDLLALERQYPEDMIQFIYFHIAAFEMNKLCSLQPDLVDFGPYQRYCTPAFFELWSTVLKKVWAQWRYENDLPFYDGPRLNGAAKYVPKPLVRRAVNGEILLFFGGGKDSLVSARLLEKLNIPYATLAYSHSGYGQAAPQHGIIDSLLSRLNPRTIHRQYFYDSFIDSPILQINRQLSVKQIVAAETPSSVFAALPLILAHPYRYIALAHEKSANKGNLIWAKTGEEVNHQWGKSFEAEQLINHYLQKYLIADLRYFSLLQPLYDVVIFNLLREDQDLIKYAHSCNIAKPWCMKCPKCAYVWLNYMAYLPTGLVNEIFGHQNLFDLPENQSCFRQMLGLTAHTPFECIGQVEECRLAFKLCQLKGLKGRALDLLQHLEQLDFGLIARAFTAVDHREHGLPEAIATALLNKFEAASVDSRNYIRKFITLEKSNLSV